MLMQSQVVTEIDKVDFGTLAVGCWLLAAMRYVTFSALSYFEANANVNANVNQSRLLKTQRQCVSTHQQFHGITHRRILKQLNLYARQQPHIQKMLPQSTLTTNCLNNSALTYLQFPQSHNL